MKTQFDIDGENLIASFLNGELSEEEMWLQGAVLIKREMDRLGITIEAAENLLRIIRELEYAH